MCVDFPQVNGEWDTFIVGTILSYPNGLNEPIENNKNIEFFHRNCVPIVLYLQVFCRDAAIKYMNSYAQQQNTQNSSKKLKFSPTPFKLNKFYVFIRMIYKPS